MIELQEIADYVTEKTKITNLSTTNYITTENMLPNRGGVVKIGNLPQANKATRFVKGDVLVSNIRPYFKKIWYADQNGGCSNDVLVFRTKNGQYKKFLYYVLAQDIFFDFMTASANGTKMPRGNKKTILKFLVPDFDFNTQKRIADILSAYDDLIENNQKQIKLLEEAAQRLYKEWFIALHFPAHENTPTVNGIPEGWGYVPLNQLIAYEIGGGWGSDTITNEREAPAYVIRGTDLYDLTHGNYNEIPYRYHSKTNLTARALQDGDIIFEVSGGSKTEGVARTALIRRAILEQFDGQVMCASFCKLMRPANAKMSQYLYDTFLYLRSSGETEKYDKRSASSIVNYRWKDFLEQQMILVPSEVVIEEYNNLSGNIYQKILSCSRTIQTAVIARDRLLPKLMSGEIEV